MVFAYLRNALILEIKINERNNITIIDGWLKSLNITENKYLKKYHFYVYYYNVANLRLTFDYPS
jgi:hypothetical protein